MPTIDIVCTVPAPTLAQVRAWLTRGGWYVVDPGPLGREMHHDRWSHPTHGSAWVPREEFADWLVYVSTWIVDRAWQIDSTPEAVYRDIVGPTKVWLVTGFSSDGAQAFAVVCMSEDAANRIAGEHVSGPENVNAYSIEECEVQP